jgi:hypothetical protein
MAHIETEAFVNAITSLLEEIHVSPADPRATWVTSNLPGSGFLGTLDSVPAGLASRPPAPGQNTMAAHAGHLRYALSLAVRAMRGENPYASADWPGSWRTQVVDDAGWAALRADLRSLHAELLAGIRSSSPSWSGPDILKGTISLVGHGAYHLGALRTIHALLVKKA